jgi:two-component system sensor kinase FixL
VLSFYAGPSPVSAHSFGFSGATFVSIPDPALSRRSLTSDNVAVAMATVESRIIEQIVPFMISKGRRAIIAGIVLLVAAIAITDARIPEVSLGGLYMIPMLLAALLTSSRGIIALALVCAVLRCTFDNQHFVFQYAVHFASALLAYLISGLFMSALIRNREMTLQHLKQLKSEQKLRAEAEERLRTLVESSPAAIFTLNETGNVVAANHAADALFGMEAAETMEGKSIAAYMPALAEAVRLGNSGEPFRTAAQAQGRKKSGEPFFSDLWFSTYPTASGAQLAAIVVDSSEEVRNREEQNLHQLSTSSRLVMSAVLHEVRNLCSAISVVYSNFRERDVPCRIEEIQGLESLVKGLGWVASLELHGREEAPEEILLRSVLDDLRIIIEPRWQDIDGSLIWAVGEPNARVSANGYGLLQVFMNLAQNSHRAVQGGKVRQLEVCVTCKGTRVFVTFTDSGCGVANPQCLFQPFQKDADVTGLGLFVSRTLVRSYGGELRYEPIEGGAQFVVELPLAGERKNHA